ncbi:hypothetical protein LSTR_LSTR000421 [Laodelphax striatellus]|uniref:Envelope fusion protein n=1 Tax=Laodelphax striatellus TaxID=195883 RepID=A0A482X4D2_LAOST|nr:hypothetical protein LSTR_LSTR000421 [Laodelphax striatellus]
MKYSDVDKCAGELYTLCPPDLPLFLHSNSCVFHMFINDEQSVQQYCEKYLVSRQFEPILYRIPETKDWIYSVSEPVRVVCECSLSEPCSTVEIIKGVGIMDNIRNCYVHSDKFVLLPSSSGTCTVDLNRTTIVLPVIQDIFNIKERSLLHGLFQNSSSQHTNERIRTLQKQITATEPGVSINHLAHEMTAAERWMSGVPVEDNSHDTMYTVLLTIMTIAIVIAVMKALRILLHCLASTLYLPDSLFADTVPLGDIESSPQRRQASQASPNRSLAPATGSAALPIVTTQPLSSAVYYTKPGTVTA